MRVDGCVSGSPHFCTEDSAQMCATRWKGTTCRRRCTSVPRTNVLVVAEAVSGTAVSLLRLQSSSRYEKVKSTAAVVYRQFFYLADVTARMRDGGLRADEGERPPLPERRRVWSFIRRKSGIPRIDASSNRRSQTSEET